MARKPHIQYRNMQQVLNADPALVTADIDTLSGVTASAAELNYLDTSAVGTVTASKVMTVDENSEVSGGRRKGGGSDGGEINATMAGASGNNTRETSAAVVKQPTALLNKEIYV